MTPPCPRRTPRGPRAERSGSRGFAKLLWPGGMAACRHARSHEALLRRVDRQTRDHRIVRQRLRASLTLTLMLLVAGLAAGLGGCQAEPVDDSTAVSTET